MTTALPGSLKHDFQVGNSGLSLALTGHSISRADENPPAQHDNHQRRGAGTCRTPRRRSISSSGCDAGTGFTAVAATCTGIESVNAILLAASRADTTEAEIVVVVRRVVVVAIGRAEVVVVVVEATAAFDPV